MKSDRFSLLCFEVCSKKTAAVCRFSFQVCFRTCKPTCCRQVLAHCSRTMAPEDVQLCWLPTITIQVMHSSEKRVLGGLGHCGTWGPLQLEDWYTWRIRRNSAHIVCQGAFDSGYRLSNNVTNAQQPSPEVDGCLLKDQILTSCLIAPGNATRLQGLLCSYHIQASAKSEQSGMLGVKIRN